MLNLGPAALTLQIGGALSGAVGSYYGAKSNKRQLQMQATMADLNAHIAEIGAQSALAAGQKEVASYTMQAGQVMGKQRAAQAANGVDLSSGSASEVRASTEIIKDIDKQQIETNAVRSAWGYRMNEVEARNAARAARAGAKAMHPGAVAGATLLTGAGSVAGSWYSLDKVGALKPDDAKPKTVPMPGYNYSTRSGWV